MNNTPEQISLINALATQKTKLLEERAMLLRKLSLNDTNLRDTERRIGQWVDRMMPSRHTVPAIVPEELVTTSTTDGGTMTLLKYPAP